ncbi:MAG: hypothetical protein ACR2OH_10285 [Microthrixaceae bacterium]
MRTFSRKRDSAPQSAETEEEVARRGGTGGNLADKFASFIGRGMDRRQLLRRTAMAGSAMAVVPGTFVLRPGTAYAALCQPGALCYDGYTEFCCRLTGANRCPPNSVLGGWWKVDGHQYCGGGPRYYMDCHGSCGSCGCGGNGVCSGSCSGTVCGCAWGDCNNRKAGCTHFRYGQCNQHMRCLGPIKCRVVSCSEPWKLDGSCTRAVRTDNVTRYHHRPCLLVDAIGGLDSVEVVPGGVRLRGWSLDPGTTGPNTVNVYSCLRPSGSFQANTSRPDIGQFFPGHGPNHGFDLFLRLCPGEQLISVASVDTSGQGSTWLGHQMVNIVPQGFGHFDSATPSVGNISVAGWLVDTDAYAPSTIDIRVDGRVVRTVVANRHRADVIAAYPHLGGAYGFAETIPADPGNHTVCIVGRNVNGGTAIDLGCRTVTVPANPTGALESVTSPGPGQLRVLGYASDPDTTSAIQVSVNVDGTPQGTFTANAPRSDGHDGHGFDITLSSITAGSHEVCVTALNVGGGANVALGCENALVASTVVGEVTELAAVPGGVQVATTPVMQVGNVDAATMRLLVDGGYRGSFRADPSGFEGFFELPEGAHEVAVVAKLDGPGTVPLIMATARLEIPPAIPGTTAEPESVGQLPSQVGAEP